ncbi:DUF2057 family protein [Marinobacter zhanjiangensis]|uniref:DUF2057 domain-containing protein n=1 Tax=Marinobacter zhanjiangensis TaxID=578215 RepID=A0ABQ3B5K2_9GAMM|nr:DUF2057 family protein [Marinobacter zhanjiangensis]GGY79444.1 hypothetical protein GCM10007071_28650 [Marinobacter zhanjiangensis]
MLARYIKVPRTGLSWLKLLVPALAIVVVSGCSTGMSRVQTWDGEASGEVAVLKAPSSVKVREVNGRRVGNFLMDDLAIDYELLPGTNTVVFTHKTIWAKSGVIRDGESAVHVVESAPQQFTINTRPGEVYRFDIPEVTTRREAQRFASSFSAELITDDGSVVARSEPFEGYPQQQQVASQPSSGTSGEANVVTGRPTGAPAPVVQGQGNNRMDTLDGLKVLWERASGEEKREFLRWAFD